MYWAVDVGDGPASGQPNHVDTIGRHARVLQMDRYHCSVWGYCSGTGVKAKVVRGVLAITKGNSVQKTHLTPGVGRFASQKPMQLGGVPNFTKIKLRTGQVAVDALNRCCRRLGRTGASR